MSREFYQTMGCVHAARAENFAADPRGRHVELRITDTIYVYLYEDGVHVQTQTVTPWWRDGRYPSDATVRRRVHAIATIGRAPIISIDWRG